MRRLLRIILVLALVGGAYELGRQPNSPDVFGWIADAYHGVAGAAGDISQRAEADGTGLIAAGWGYFTDPAPDAAPPQP